MQVPGIGILSCRSDPCLKDQRLQCRPCRGKVLSCSTTHSTGCTFKSRGTVVGGVQAVGAIANNESLQVANGEKRLAILLVFALFICRSLLAACLSTIPAAKASMVFGAGSGESSLHRTLAWAGKTRCCLDQSSYPPLSHLSKALGRAYVLRHVLLFPCLRTARSCVQPAKARRAI